MAKGLPEKTRERRVWQQNLSFFRALRPTLLLASRTVASWKQIPISARIFAVVDVWDALRSDRPYREAWPEDKAREYIRSESGIHFDTRVVGTFLELA